MVTFLVISQYVVQTIFSGLASGWLVRRSEDKYGKVQQGSGCSWGRESDSV
jgi:hypothetical protein